MARLSSLQSRYALGMRQDEYRGALPDGASWNLVDFIPDLGGYLIAKRGGWSRASPDINATVAGASWIISLAYAPFAAGAKLVGFTANGHAVLITSSSSVTDLGAAGTPIQAPVFHNDKLIIPKNDGTSGPSYYDGTTLGTLGGTPPPGRYATVFKDYTLLGPTAAKPTYTYFSPPSNPAGAWNTAASGGSWWSVSEPVTGYAALTNAVLIFMADRTARLRGSTPPPNGDMILDDPLFNIGCTDARSIVTYGGSAIFANPQGIYISNGSIQPEDLTATVGLKRYWQSLFRGYFASPAGSTWRIAAGLYRNRYIVTVTNDATFVDCLMIDLEHRSACRLANVPAQCFARGIGVQEELYFGSRSEARVNALASIFTPSAALKNDANGSAVLPVYDSRFYKSVPGQKTWRSLVVGYDMRDAATDNPTLTASIWRESELDVSGTQMAQGLGFEFTGTISKVLAGTTKPTRAKVPLRFSSPGIAFRLAQTNASRVSMLYEMEADVHARETSRLVP